MLWVRSGPCLPWAILRSPLAKATMAPMAANWLTTDEADDVAGSIRHALRSAAFLADDPQSWKWVTLALHSALQGACVCHLTTTAAPIGAVTKANAKEWLAYFEESRTSTQAKPPQTKLMALPALLKEVRKAQSAGDRSNEAGVAVSDKDLNWLRYFHDVVRNQLVHFEPMGWSLEVSGIPDIAALSARIINDIAHLGWAFRHRDEHWLAELRDNLLRLPEVLRSGCEAR